MQWYSQDPRNPQAGFTPYPQAQSDAIEQSFAAGKPSHDLHIGNMVFTVKFADMRQYNQSGGSRHVQRGNAAASAKPFAMPAFSFGRASSAAATAPNGAITDTLRHLVANVLVTGGTSVGGDRLGLSGSICFLANNDIKTMDKLCGDVLSKLHTFRHAYSPAGGFFSSGPSQTLEDRFKAAKIDPEVVLHILTVIIELFAVSGLTADCNTGDANDLHGLAAGKPVPAYNANAVSESIYRRKYLSLLGLRNLALRGPEIFAQLHFRLFSGNPSDYGNNDGPHLMRYLTGNVVDLDTVVLDCNRQHKTLGPKGSNPNSFFSSEEGRRIAVAAAGPLIEVFIDELKLTKEVAAKRNLTPLPVAGSNIPVATNNTDRGKWPLWGYANVGVLSYHANVPHLPDVTGALLKAPFHLVKAFLMIVAKVKLIENGAVRTDPPTIDAFISAMREFFDEAVSDSCFNGKWKQVEAYCDKIESCDTIRVLLGNLQRDNQKIFTTALFDSDDDARTNERRALEALVAGKGLRGRDPATGSIRLICAEDVAQYIKDTMPPPDMSSQWADLQRATPSFVSAIGGGQSSSAGDGGAASLSAAASRSPLLSKPMPDSLAAFASTADQQLAMENATRLSNTGVGGSYLNTVSQQLLADRSPAPRAASTPRRNAANNTTPNRRRNPSAGGVASPSSSSYYGDQSVFESLVDRGKLSQKKKELARLEAVAEEKKRCRSVPKISPMGHNLNRNSSIFQRLQRVQEEKEKRQEFDTIILMQKEEKHLATLFKPKISDKGRRAAATNPSDARTAEKFSFKTKQRMDQIRTEKAVREMEKMLGSPDINPRSVELAARRQEREGLSGYSHLDAMLERDRLAKLARYEQHERELAEAVPGTPRITEYAASLQRGGAGGVSVGDRLYRAAFESKSRLSAEQEAESQRRAAIASRPHTSGGGSSSVRARSAPSRGQPSAVGEVQGSLMDHLAASMSHREEKIRSIQEEARREYTYRPAINAVSDAIAARLPLTSQERLLDGKGGHSFRSTTTSLRHPSPSDASPATPRQQQQPSAANVSLFERLQVAEARRKVRMEAVKRGIEASRMAECTFTPTTTLGYYPVQSTGADVVSSRNADWMRQREEKLERMRAEHANDDLAGCTFEPSTTGMPPAAARLSVSTADVVTGYDSFVERHQKAKQEAAAASSFANSRGEGPSSSQRPNASSIYARPL